MDRKHRQDPYASAYGVVPYEMFRGGPWTRINDLGETAAGVYVHVFGTPWSVRVLSRTRAIVVVLNSSSTVRCVVDAAGSQDGVVTTRMVRFAATLSQGFAIDAEGVVSLPESVRPPLATTQQVEIQVRKLHPIGRGVPFQPHDRKSQRPCKSITPRPSVKLEDLRPCSAYLIIRTIQLVFSAGTVFFLSQQFSQNSIFQPIQSSFSKPNGVEQEGESSPGS